MAIKELVKINFDRHMKNTIAPLIFIAILITGICIAGCVSTASVNSAKQLEQVDPIIGTWQLSLNDGRTYTDAFFSDGRYSLTTPDSRPSSYWGIWSKTRENEYSIKIGETGTENYIYHPDTDTITIATVPTVHFYRVKQGSVQTSGTSDTLCGELVYCGIAPAGYQTRAIKSDRCEQLADLRSHNDQKVLACLKNPYEANAAKSRELLQCLQGVGSLDYCYGIADKNGMSHASMKSSWCQTNSC